MGSGKILGEDDPINPIKSITAGGANRHVTKSCGKSTTTG
jgi:hypothetical protein